MSIFASVHPDTFSDDPAPYVHIDYDYSEARLPRPADGFEFAPRAEFARPTTHPVNPLLVSFRRSYQGGFRSQDELILDWLQALTRANEFLTTGTHTIEAGPATRRIDAILDRTSRTAPDAYAARASIEVLLRHTVHVIGRLAVLRSL
ncbi:hypothetical protein ACWGJ9_11015 [Curtobacterium citreum]